MMKKILIWCIPTCLIILFRILVLLIGTDVADEWIGYFLLVVLFAIPCYYIVLIGDALCNKELLVKLGYSLFFILVNAAIICPESLQVYFGFRMWNGNDMDFFPLVAGLPAVINIIGCVIMIIKRNM